MPFIDELCLNLRAIISDLEPGQVQVFYEAVGYMVSAQADQPTRDGLLMKLMEWPNSMWFDILETAKRTNGTPPHNDRTREHTLACVHQCVHQCMPAHPLHRLPTATFAGGAGLAIARIRCTKSANALTSAGESLKEPATMKQLQTIIRTNERVATALGHPYMVQLGHIYVDLLNVYKAYSELINTAIATSGATNVHLMHTSGVRAMRAVKKETLRLLDTFIEKSEARPTPAKPAPSHSTPLSLRLLECFIHRPDAQEITLPCAPPHQTADCSALRSTANS